MDPKYCSKLITIMHGFFPTIVHSSAQKLVVFSNSSQFVPI